jgi:hypothetical protein
LRGVVGVELGPQGAEGAAAWLRGAKAVIGARSTDMGRGNWWWPGQWATTVHQGSASISDDKQAVGTSDDHASPAWAGLAARRKYRHG